LKTMTKISKPGDKRHGRSCWWLGDEILKAVDGSLVWSM
jgi:hypothetical protein